MTLKDKIIEELFRNPESQYTVGDLKAITGGKANTIRFHLRRLVEEGVISRIQDLIFPTKFARFCATPATPAREKYSRKTPAKLPHIRCLSLYIIYLLRINNNKIIKKERHQTPSHILGALSEMNSVLEKLLNAPGKELLESVSDEVVEKVHHIFEEQIFPLLRFPVETSSGAPAEGGTPRSKKKDPVKSLDPPGGVFPDSFEGESSGSPAKGIHPAKAARERYKGTEKSLERACGGKKVHGKKASPKPKSKYQEYRDKKLKQKERRVSENPFTPHVRYFGLNPEQRNYEFALAWYKIMKEFFPSYRIENKDWEQAVHSMALFRRSGNFREIMRKARIEADLLNARYEDYMVGIAEYYFERNAKSSREVSPNVHHLAGPEHTQAAKDHLENGLKGRILITLQDIQYNGNADFLLAENFNSPLSSEQQDQIKIFLQDVAFPELERAAFLSGHELWDLMNYSIDYGLIPRQWAEGYGTHHRLEKLTRYIYEPPTRFTDRTIFRTVFE